MAAVTEDQTQDMQFEISDNNHSATTDSCFVRDIIYFEQSPDVISWEKYSDTGFQHA